MVETEKAIAITAPYKACSLLRVVRFTFSDHRCRLPFCPTYIRRLHICKFKILSDINISIYINTLNVFLIASTVAIYWGGKRRRWKCHCMSTHSLGLRLRMGKVNETDNLNCFIFLTLCMRRCCVVFCLEDERERARGEKVNCLSFFVKGSL